MCVNLFNVNFCLVTFLSGKVINHKGVTIVGYTNIESRMASTASSLFAGNVTNLLLTMQDKKVVKMCQICYLPAVIISVRLQ